MKGEAHESTRHRLLVLLKTRSPLTASTIARRLGVTAIAIHQHLAALQREGLADFTPERGKVGRPAHLWRLTPAAHRLFPDGHAELALDLLEAVAARFGERGLERLSLARMRRQLRSYRARMPERSAPLDRQLSALARIRSSDGFMAECRLLRDGTMQLLEHHCPIAKAARSRPILCEAELELVRLTLGKRFLVSRISHIFQGDPHCAYRVERCPPPPC